MSINGDGGTRALETHLYKVLVIGDYAVGQLFKPPFFSPWQCGKGREDGKEASDLVAKILNGSHDIFFFTLHSSSLGCWHPFGFRVFDHH